MLRTLASHKIMVQRPRLHQTTQKTANSELVNNISAGLPSAFLKQVRRTEMTGSKRWSRKIWNDWSASGDAVIYLATPDDHEGYTGKYSIDWTEDVSRKELRAYRELRRRKGLPVAAQGQQQLKYGLFVIFGAGTSPLDAVVSLRRLADEITKEGLFVGQRSNRDSVVETCDGKILT
jgi:hypothetical protein